MADDDEPQSDGALRKKIFRYTAVGLDLLGFGALAYGYIEENNVAKNVKHIDKGHIKDGPKADRAAVTRNAAYITSGVLIAAGVSIHIFF